MPIPILTKISRAQWHFKVTMIYLQWHKPVKKQTLITQLTAKLLWGEYHRTPLWEVNIGSGNGLVMSGNKPLLGPMLTQICIALLGQIELTLLHVIKCNIAHIIAKFHCITNSEMTDQLYRIDDKWRVVYKGQYHLRLRMNHFFKIRKNSNISMNKTSSNGDETHMNTWLCRLQNRNG